MTNKATASQPKSIGDDAQFIKLLREYNHVSEMVRGHAKREWAAFIAYIDSRAPADQGSATIQAAPDDAQILKIAAEQDYGDEDPKCIIRLARALFAATIQEPVMVAEPDESQWVDRCSYDAQVDEWAIERSNLETEIERLKSAAPMVADPAGVALTYPCWSCKKPYTLDQRSYADGRCPHCDVDIDLELDDEPDAATVKAVPSEALNADVIHWTKFSDRLPADDTPIFWRDGKDYGTGYFCKEDVEHWKGEWFAAPLADKTGGGE